MLVYGVSSREASELKLEGFQRLAIGIILRVEVKTMSERTWRSSDPAAAGFTGESAEQQRIARLENQVEGLRKAVRELADALQEELTSLDARIALVDARAEEAAKAQVSQTRAIKKQEDRLRKGLGVISDALAVLTLSSSSSSIDIQPRDSSNV